MVTSFLATRPVLDLDDASTQIFGEAKAMIERQGRRLVEADLFIGAIAGSGRALSASARYPMSVAGHDQRRQQSASKESVTREGAGSRDLVLRVCRELDVVAGR